MRDSRDRWVIDETRWRIALILRKRGDAFARADRRERAASPPGARCPTELVDGRDRGDTKPFGDRDDGSLDGAEQEVVVSADELGHSGEIVLGGRAEGALDQERRLDEHACGHELLVGWIEEQQRARAEACVALVGCRLLKAAPCRPEGSAPFRAGRSSSPSAHPRGSIEGRGHRRLQLPSRERAWASPSSHGSGAIRSSGDLREPTPVLFKLCLVEFRVLADGPHRTPRQGSGARSRWDRDHGSGEHPGRPGDPDSVSRAADSWSRSSGPAGDARAHRPSDHPEALLPDWKQADPATSPRTSSSRDRGPAVNPARAMRRSAGTGSRYRHSHRSLNAGDLRERAFCRGRSPLGCGEPSREILDRGGVAEFARLGELGARRRDHALRLL